MSPAISSETIGIGERLSCRFDEHAGDDDAAGGRRVADLMQVGAADVDVVLRAGAQPDADDDVHDDRRRRDDDHQRRR